jgi:hypothetical protein
MLMQRPAVGQVFQQPILAAHPPPQYVSRQLYTEPTDKYVFEQAQEAREHPTPGQILARSLVQEARRFNFTAAPPAHIKPSVWSDPVDISDTVTFPAGAPGAYQTVCSFTTPPGRWARIEHYGVQNLDSAYTYNGEILWGFRLNGRFLDQGMTDWGEQRGSMVFMRPTFILMMNEGITLDFMARRAIAGAQQDIQMAFRGWTWRLRNNYEGTQGAVTAY